MKPITSEQMTRLQGYYQQKYGVRLDETVTSILCEIEQMGLKNNNTIQVLCENIKERVKVVRFDNNHQAFWYAVGKFGIPGISLPLFIILGWIYVTNLSQYQTIVRLIDQYPAFKQYAELMKVAQTTTNPQGTFVVLKPTESAKMAVGVNCLYHKNERLVYVPIMLNENYKLGKSSN